jgi:hypothetical protein
MDPAARELLDRARHAHDATDSDRARVRRKLALRVAGTAAAGGGLAKASVLGSSALMKVMVPVALALVIGGYIVHQRTSPRALPPPSFPVPITVPTTEQVAPLPTVAPTTIETEAPPPIVPTVAIHAAKPPPPVATASDLEAETKLLADAQGAIQRSDFGAALAKLDEHAKAFPSGALAEERDAARVVALCGAGRTVDAQTLAKSFLAHHPRSPLAPRVKSSCAAQP